VPCIPARCMTRHSTKTVRTSIGTKALRSLVRDEFYWVASAAASAALRDLPRYLPWLCRDALHPSAPDATRVARLNQRFPSNIAEGAARQTRKELIQHLYIAAGSASELDTQLEIARIVDGIKEEEILHLQNETERVAMMLRALIKSLKPEVS